MTVEKAQITQLNKERVYMLIRLRKTFLQISKTMTPKLVNMYFPPKNETNF